MAEPISCELYNCIASIESQQQALEHSTFYTIWNDIFDIFVKHAALERFGLALLHRHLRLSPGYIMMHSWDFDERDVCRPEIVGTREAYPLSYCLKDGQFMAYEFTSKRTPTPAAAFLQDMADVLQNNALGNIISLAHIHDRNSVWTETMLESARGTLATKSDHELGCHCNRYIITEWAFEERTGVPLMLPLKGCERQDNGGHARTE